MKYIKPSCNCWSTCNYSERANWVEWHTCTIWIIQLKSFSRFKVWLIHCKGLEPFHVDHSGVFCLTHILQHLLQRSFLVASVGLLIFGHCFCLCPFKLESDLVSIYSSGASRSLLLQWLHSESGSFSQAGINIVEAFTLFQHHFLEGKSPNCLVFLLLCKVLCICRSPSSVGNEKSNGTFIRRTSIRYISAETVSVSPAG